MAFVVLLDGSGAELADRIAPLLKNGDGSGRALCGALGAILDAGASLKAVTEDSGAFPGWTVVFDPRWEPREWLPWTAAVYGVSLVGATTEAQQRARIQDLPPQQRGTTAQMVAAVEATLAPGYTPPRVIERDGDPYYLTIVIRSADVVDLTRSQKAAVANKPAGLVLSVISSSSPLISEGSRAISAATATFAAATLSDVV
jgi:hypothetical protein